MEAIDQKRDIIFNQIAEVICKGEDVSLDALISPVRYSEVVFARQLVLYFGKEFKLGSLESIGNRLKRDHATVMHSIKTIENYLTTDKVKAEKVKGYREKLGTVQVVSDKLESLRYRTSVLKSRITQIQSDATNIQIELNNLEGVITSLEM